jgi:hypothetical protein
MTRRRVLIGAAVLALAWSLSPAAAADDPVCALLLAEERSDQADLELSVELARAELDAAVEIHGLLDRLWKNDAVERLLYLTGKHDRDASAIRVERAERRVERQQALLDQLGALCGGKDDREAQRRAYVRYRRAECAIRGRDAALAEVDLEFRLEVLASFRDLRANEAATRQDIVRSERDVEMARRRLAHARELEAGCRTELERIEAPAEP